VDTLGPAAQSLLDSVHARLVACERPVGLVSLVPGNTVSWDNCCSASDGGGQLWARIVSALPNPQGGQPCDITDLQVRMGIGAVRCMHGVDEEGFPTAEEMTADTLGMTKDADLMLQGIRTWQNPVTVPTKTIRVEQGLPLGPAGYCGGWEWTVMFRLLLCAGCDES
jgi:hypothetical protein